MTLTFTQIEQLLGVRLPPTARTASVFWANSPRRASGHAWLAAGWRVAALDRRGEHLTVAREAAE